MWCRDALPVINTFIPTRFVAGNCFGIVQQLQWGGGVEKRQFWRPASKSYFVCALISHEYIISQNDASVIIGPYQVYNTE